MGEDLAAACRRELDELEHQGRLRRRPDFDGAHGRVLTTRIGGRRRKLHNWASNDYLGMLGRLTVRNAAARALRQSGPGSGAARLLAGGLHLHRRFEQRLAHWQGSEDALLCTTGFQANLAALTCLADAADDAIILDRLCHASTYDGLRLAAGRMLRFRHNDCADLERQLVRAESARRRLVCVESVYSMDGDEAPLVAIRELCDAHDAVLLVDEAHALGVFGAGGRGLCHALGLRPDVLVGTASKSLGAQGGFLCAAAPVCEWMVNRARSFIYSTAPAPAAIGAAIGSLDVLRKEPDLSARLLARAAWLRQDIRALGYRVPEGRSPIIPLLIGTESETIALAERLRAAGHYCPPIRPPTVPPGSCRLRITCTLAHTESDCRRLLRALAAARPGIASCE